MIYDIMYENDIVYIHGHTKAKVLKIMYRQILVEYLEDSHRVQKGQRKTVIRANIRKQKQSFDKRNRLIKETPK